MAIGVVFASTSYLHIWSQAVETWLRAITFGDRYLRENGLGKVCGVGITARQYTHSAENQLVRDFLADAQATHLFLTESDMLLPDQCLEKLLEVQQPIVSGVYFLRNGNGQPCLYKRAIGLKGNPYGMSPLTLFPTDKPWRLDGCPGLGCVLIERRVFAAMADPWFQLKDGPDGHGSDLYFYTHVRQAGFPVWVQPAVLCGQVDMHVESVQTYHQRLQDDPAFAGSGFIVGMQDYTGETPCGST